MKKGWGVRKIASDSMFAILVFGVLCASPAQAYLDGATISLILQAVTGAIASALLFGKIYWTKICSFFTRAQQPGNDTHG